MESAVAAAKAAFPVWSESSVLSRQQVMFNLQHLIKKNMVRRYLNPLSLKSDQHQISPCNINAL